MDYFQVTPSLNVDLRLCVGKTGVRLSVVGRKS